MSVELTLYLVELIGNVSIFFGVVGICCLVASFLLGVDDRHEGAKRFFVIAVALLGIACVFPSHKTMYMMVGARYLKDSSIPKKVHDLLDKKLNELLGEK